MWHRMRTEEEYVVRIICSRYAEVVKPSTDEV